MSFLARPEHGTVTAASGTASATIKTKGDRLFQVLVKAATGSTTFDVKLVDIYGFNVYEVTSITGEHSELLDLPTYGNYTMTISNASVDEAIEYLFNFREK